MDLSQLTTATQFTGDLCYLFLAVVALWGAYTSVVAWRRIAQLRFKSEQEQATFLDKWESYVLADDFTAAQQMCEDDSRVVVQLAKATVEQRGLEPARLRHFLSDRYARDVSADLEFRVSWINTVIKVAPMLGLFGTVLGMMAAFGKLGGNSKVEATGLAEDIALALITTALGLMIAIPLSLVTASLNIRIRKMEDLVNVGLTRLLDVAAAARLGGRK